MAKIKIKQNGEWVPAIGGTIGVEESYILPTASTSTLGGVKVDGETVTITNGVISANGDKTYLHRQNSASAVWEITHNLGKYPSVSVVDSGDSVVVGDVLYINENKLQITFSAPFSGKCFLN